MLELVEFATRGVLAGDPAPSDATSLLRVFAGLIVVVGLLVAGAGVLFLRIKRTMPGLRVVGALGWLALVVGILVVLATLAGLLWESLTRSAG
jgi:hypothetical protein